MKKTSWKKFDDYNLEIIDNEVVNIEIINEEALIEIKMPNYVKKVGIAAFRNCHNLVKVDLNKVEVVDIMGFFGCDALEEVIISENCKELKEGAFLDCFNLKKVIIDPNSPLENITFESFSNTNIETIELPKKIRYIEEDAFKGCRNLKVVVLYNKSNVKIDKLAFDYLPKIEENNNYRKIS